MSFERQEIIRITSTLEAADHAAEALIGKTFEVKQPAGAAKPSRRISKERMRFTLAVSWIAGYLEAIDTISKLTGDTWLIRTMARKKNRSETPE
ncbi:MAG: hypothetical protein WA817_15905 [Candidatus Acidiferrum sp.]